MFKKLRTVIYRTNDLDATKAWYSKILEQEPYFDQPFYVGFDVHGFELGIDPADKELDKRNQTVPYWSVDNIEDAIKKLQELGAVIRTALQDVGGGTKVATLDDPWGNAIGLIEEQP